MSDNGNIKANTSFASNRFQHPSPGVGAVGQYQTSGIPYAAADRDWETSIYFDVTVI